MKRVIED